MTRQMIYIGDPMCSWCWGFSPVKRALEQQCAGRAEVSLVVGGLHPGTTEAQDDARKEFLRHHWQDVNQRTGQEFSFDILERDDFAYDTEPACRAAVAVRLLYGNERALAFFAELQREFYVNGADVTRTDVLTGIAQGFGVADDTFAGFMDTDEMRQAPAGDFEQARALGVSGFPTVVLNDGDDYAYLTVGYQPHDQLGPLLEGWLDGTIKQKATEAAS